MRGLLGEKGMGKGWESRDVWGEQRRCLWELSPHRVWVGSMATEAFPFPHLRMKLLPFPGPFFGEWETNPSPKAQEQPLAAPSFP